MTLATDRPNTLSDIPRPYPLLDPASPIFEASKHAKRLADNLNRQAGEETRWELPKCWT